MRLARAMTTPLVPDDYLALMNPGWLARELTRTEIENSSTQEVEWWCSCATTLAGKEWRRSADQPDRAVSQFDREGLQRPRAGRSLDHPRERLERPLRTSHHLPRRHVIASGMPRAL
jgi:hypothetical protein